MLSSFFPQIGLILVRLKTDTFACLKAENFMDRKMKVKLTGLNRRTAGLNKWNVGDIANGI